MYETCIIIPYRNRKKDLDYFLKHSWSLIKNNVKDCLLLIVEQEDGKLFNRGKVINCGFDFIKKDIKYFIFHDVDLNPKDKIIHLYKKNIEKNNILGIINSPWVTLGGIIKINKEDFVEMNGFPNNFWGWGVEDRALYNRGIFHNKQINYNHYTNDKNINDFILRFNDSDDRKKDNINNKTNIEYYKFKTFSEEKQKEHIIKSGLNNLEYYILDKTIINKDIIKIKISI